MSSLRAVPTKGSSANGRAVRSWTVVLDGTQLRELRRARGLTQAELAGLAGISLTTVARLDRRHLVSCRGRTAARLAAALGEPPVTIAVLRA